MRRSGLSLFAMAALGVACGQPASPVVVGIATGPTLSLYDANGGVVKRIDLGKPVAGFALSPAQSQLVIVSPEREHGGALYLVDLNTGSRRKLTAGPFVFQHLNPNEREVYDGPAFSPDGRSLVFAVHGDQPGDGNDAEENSGPLAILDLRTLKPRVLKATNNIDGEGPCSESDPKWSPDGKWILFNCETGAFLTNVAGTVLRDLKIDPSDGYSSAIGWVGGNCVLYEQTPESDRNAERHFLLNLATGRSVDAAAPLRFPKKEVVGLMQMSSDTIVFKPGGSVVVAVAGKTLVLPAPENGQLPATSSAQVEDGWPASQIPDDCRAAFIWGGRSPQAAR